MINPQVALRMKKIQATGRAAAAGGVGRGLVVRTPDSAFLSWKLELNQNEH